MEIRPIHSEADYTAALADIEQYFDREPKPGTPEADRFDVLAALIGDYERQHWMIEAPDAVDAIAEVMALRGYARADLTKLLGSPSRASEIMNRKRRLTLEQARKLHDDWGVPAASLLLTGGPEPAPKTAAPRKYAVRKPALGTAVEVVRYALAGRSPTEVSRFLARELGLRVTAGRAVGMPASGRRASSRTSGRGTRRSGSASKPR